MSVFPIVHIFTKIEWNSWMNPFVPLEGIASLYLLYFQRQVATSKCYVFDFAVVRVSLHPNWLAFVVIINLLFYTYRKFIGTKKAESICLSAREGVQALNTQTGNTPRILQGAFICFSVCLEFLDFSLAQKSAKRFFFLKQTIQSRYDWLCKDNN